MSWLLGPVPALAGTGSEFSGSGFEIRCRAGLGFPEFVSKPVGLLEAILNMQCS